MSGVQPSSAPEPLQDCVSAVEQQSVTLQKHSRSLKHTYLILERNGCPQESELDNWIKAEAKVAAMTVADARPAVAPTAKAQRSRRKTK